MGRQRFPRVLTPIAFADGPTVSAAAQTSCIPPRQKFTLPNNYWEEGVVWQLRATGRISSLITTPGTARFQLMMGAVAAFDSQAILLDSVAAHVTVGWVLDVLLTCRAVGNGTVTQLFGQGTWTCEDILGVPASAPKGVPSAILPWNAAPALGTGFDNTIANSVDLMFTQTVATGALIVHQYMIEEKN